MSSLNFRLWKPSWLLSIWPSEVCHLLRVQSLPFFHRFGIDDTWFDHLRPETSCLLTLRVPAHTMMTLLFHFLRLRLAYPIRQLLFSSQRLRCVSSLSVRLNSSGPLIQNVAPCTPLIIDALLVFSLFHFFFPFIANSPLCLLLRWCCFFSDAATLTSGIPSFFFFRVKVSLLCLILFPFPVPLECSLVMFQTKRGRTKSPSGTTATQHHLCGPLLLLLCYLTRSGSPQASVPLTVIFSLF